MFTRNFRSDFDVIAREIKAQRPIALSRFGDGEWALLKKQRYKAASGWVSRGDTWLDGPLLESLEADLPGYHVGYSPPCCHPKCVGFYADTIRAPKARCTFATVFFHGNFMRAKAFFSGLDAVMVGCTRNCKIKVPANAIENPFDVDDIVQQMLEVKDKPILVAAGPAACIIVHRYWRWTKRNPENRVAVIDIGALLDQTTHGKTTRHYHEPSSGLHTHYCQWDNWDAAKQRQVVAVHNATKGRFDTFKQAPNTMKSPMQMVAERRGTPRTPKWVSNRAKGKSK